MQVETRQGDLRMPFVHQLRQTLQVRNAELLDLQSTMEFEKQKLRGLERHLLDSLKHNFGTHHTLRDLGTNTTLRELGTNTTVNAREIPTREREQTLTMTASMEQLLNESRTLRKRFD